MAHKRPRAALEADLQTKESPFVSYGTPLPPFDSKTRDDGSYVPVWQQDVTDERGRKRLHGAFTGGFSAGYFNTVGSKEGWTPSTFVSSRTNRRKNEQKSQTVEDFMDEEDLQEQEEAQKLQTNQSFAGFGTTEEDAQRKGTLMGLFKTQGETMGVQLLRRMGWKDGQGVGPRVRRKARFDGDRGDEEQEEHLFAPDDTTMVTFARKDDRKGLGFTGETGMQDSGRTQQNAEDEEEEGSGPAPTLSRQPSNKAARKPKKGGFGMGVLNDTGSDDEDPYEMGPKISYNKIVGGDKKKGKVPKAKPTGPSANPLLASKPVFTSKKSTSSGFRKCNDGRLPLAGFLLAPPLNGSTDDSDRYPRPVVPLGWKSSKSKSANPDAAQPTYQSAADAAKLSKLDPKSRALLLGEAPLPGKSIFDFLSPAARARIASTTGRTNLPAALGESIPGTTEASASSPHAHAPATDHEIPTLDAVTAAAALSRGTGGWIPYAESPAKLARYRGFLSLHAGLHSELAPRPADMTAAEFLHEMREFAHAARVFRPVTGAMASRFQSSSAVPSASSTSTTTSSTTSAEQTTLLSRPADKPRDPAEQAAEMGLYGPLTRSVLTFYPTRLVCKRFGVGVPAHVTADTEGRAAHGEVELARGDGEIVPEGGAGAGSGSAVGTAPAAAMLGFKTFAKGPVEVAGREVEGVLGTGASATTAAAAAGSTGAVELDSGRNEALEAKRAGDALFRAVFGDDSDGD